MIRHRVIRLRRRDGRGWARGRRARPPLARAGLCLVLERTLESHDPRRGQVLVPWGVAEGNVWLRRVAAPGRQRPALVGFVLRGMTVVHRDVPATCQSPASVLTYYHPACRTSCRRRRKMQARVRRGARVTGVEPGGRRGRRSARGREREVPACLVVSRRPRLARRTWGHFEVRRDPERRLSRIPSRQRAPRTCCSRRSCGTGLMTYVFPGQGRCALRRLPERREASSASRRHGRAPVRRDGGPDRRTEGMVRRRALRRTARHVRRYGRVGASSLPRRSRAHRRRRIDQRPHVGTGDVAHAARSSPAARPVARRRGLGRRRTRLRQGARPLLPGDAHLRQLVHRHLPRRRAGRRRPPCPCAASHRRGSDAPSRTPLGRRCPPTERAKSLLATTFPPERARETSCTRTTAGADDRQWGCAALGMLSASRSRSTSAGSSSAVRGRIDLPIPGTERAGATHVGNILIGR